MYKYELIKIFKKYIAQLNGQEVASLQLGQRKGIGLPGQG